MSCLCDLERLKVVFLSPLPPPPPLAPPAPPPIGLRRVVADDAGLSAPRELKALCGRPVEAVERPPMDLPPPLPTLASSLSVECVDARRCRDADPRRRVEPVDVREARPVDGRGGSDLVLLPMPLNSPAAPPPPPPLSAPPAGGEPAALPPSPEDAN